MKLIVFDVDGTLIDSQNIIVASINGAYEAVGLPHPERAKALSIVGLSLPGAMAALVGPEGPVEAMVGAYKNTFADLRKRSAIASPFFEGTRELIEDLAAKGDAMLGIATGKSRRGVNHILEQYEWGRLFATIQTADDAASKPDPEMLLRAMAETGTAPEDLVMIGDTAFDMEMASRAGVRSVGVTWGYHARDALVKQGAEVIVDSCMDLAACLDRFIRNGALTS